MESIYWVISRDCNLRCRHCYNDSEPGAEGLSFDETASVVAHLPSEAPGRIILSGGEVYKVPELLFHALACLRARYGEQIPLWIQTNGDLLDEALLDRTLSFGVSHIGVSSMDDFHPKQTLERRGPLEQLFRSRGMIDTAEVPQGALHGRGGYRDFSFWGATPESWVGRIWPRGRSLKTRSSVAGPEDDFCGRWSGARNFLAPGEGSEVNIQLAAVYPCCPMTVRPMGDLRRESLDSILGRARSNPVYQALDRGKPEEMGEALGYSSDYGRRRIAELGNCCLWCDEFFLRHYENSGEPDAAIPGGRRDLISIEALFAASPVGIPG